MNTIRTLSPLDRGLVHQWQQQGVPDDSATRTYLAERVFPVMAEELEYWRSLALELSGKPGTRFGKCTICGEVRERVAS